MSTKPISVQGYFGQLGNGTYGTNLVAARIPGLTDITAIAGGSETGYAITH